MADAPEFDHLRIEGNGPVRRLTLARPKKLTNVRAAGKDEALIITPPRKMTIEIALEWIQDDELLEVTPKALRLRKRILSASLRKR